MENNKDTKVAKCPVCNGWKMIAMMPEAEIDRDAIKDFRDLAKKGCKMDYVQSKDIRNGTIPICNCNKKPKLF
jgi:hypothetical protein